MSIKVVAFDLFGTVFDANTADPLDKRRYINVLKAWREHGTYHPVQDVPSFSRLQPFLDSRSGLQAIRDIGVKIVAASNIPRDIVLEMSQNSYINWDGVIALERYKVYKPALVAYASICDFMGCDANEVLFVTGNPGSGDDTQPRRLGMKTAVIRNGGEYPDIPSLVSLIQQENNARPDEA